jgi:hypothetical protein
MIEAVAPVDSIWRPVRESNPCRRREREATCCNSTELHSTALEGTHGELLLDS